MVRKSSSFVPSRAHSRRGLPTSVHGRLRVSAPTTYSERAARRRCPLIPEGLEAALRRCHQDPTVRIGCLARTPSSRLELLLFAGYLMKPVLGLSNNLSGIRVRSLFTASGQEAIRQRVTSCFEAAKIWHSDVLLHGWDLGYLSNAAQLARVVTELARGPLGRKSPAEPDASISLGCQFDDGRQGGRDPTPLNVAHMAVSMLDPGPSDRVFDGSSGTGTFLAMAAAHVFEKLLARTEQRATRPRRNSSVRHSRLRPRGQENTPSDATCRLLWS